MNALLLYCRPGFEKECLAEVTQLAGKLGCFGWSNLEVNSGFVVYECEQSAKIYTHWKELVFTRDAWPISAKLEDLDAKDRLLPILAEVETLMKDKGVNKFGNVSCEFAEGDDYRSTSKFAGKFVHPVRQAMRSKGWLTKKEDDSIPTLRLFFKESSQVCIGYDHSKYRAQWPMGIVRLKFPPKAPSRSTLKLEEAFIHFLGSDWREQLEDCHTAVDLGAAPGGWTWQLVNQNMHVYAVDNGPMDKALLDTGLVDHELEDGFIWKPLKSVDWLVCDMVEQPARVANLMYDWLLKRHAKYAIFNLKLPMKKRFHEWNEIKEHIESQFPKHRLPRARIQAKQLYHDREEITVFLDLGNQNG